jgi:2'-5' RNA ligase
MPPAEAPARPGPGPARLFLGVPLSPATRASLQRYVLDATRGKPLPGRPVPPDNWHLTLRFLGDTTAEARADLERRLAAADLGPAFELAFDGLGVFGPPAAARTLWLGLDEGAEPLTALAEVVEASAVASGFPPEGRPFRAHLTLARFNPPEDLRRLVGVSRPSGARERVERVVLYRSHLGRGPARYEGLRSFSLAPGAL